MMGKEVRTKMTILFIFLQVILAQIMELPIAHKLSLEPFHTMHQLLQSHPPASEQGAELRRSMISSSLSLQLLLACYAHFTHFEPDVKSSTGKCLSLVGL